LTEYEIDEAMDTFIAEHQLDQCQYWTPRWICDNAELWPAEAIPRIHNKWHQFPDKNQPRYGIIWEAQHWMAFTAQQRGDHLAIALYDGTHRAVTAYIDIFFNRVRQALSCSTYSITVLSHIQQPHGQHCGAIALLHLWAQFAPDIPLTAQHALSLYRHITGHRPDEAQHSLPTSTLTWSLSGAGPDIAQQLSKLLEDKGVPPSAKSDRAHQLISRIGADNTARILSGRNSWRNDVISSMVAIATPWASASTCVKLICGTGCPLESWKCLGSRTSCVGSSLVCSAALVVAFLFLACGMATPCLVAALMVMYCCFSSSVRIRMLTSGLLAAALRNNISAQALSILLLDQPSDDILAASGLEKIRFPALYTVTNEQILVFGAILNLGDLPIKRATHGPSSTPSTVTTAIIKFFVYKEQLNQSWADFVSAPVRALINLNKARYGVRVRKADEAKAWALLRPDTNFVDIQVQRIFEIGPIPHGTQKRQIETILKDWGWAGKVLQPGRGTPHSMTWYIGATDEPPMRVMQAFKQDVLINQIKQTDLGTPPPKVYTATRTQKHLRSTASNTSDPWLNATQDPWANYKSTAAPSASSGTDTKKHYHQLQEAIQKDIAAVVRQELAEQQSSEDATMSSTQTGRLEQLESTLQELSSQNKALKGWLHETQTKLGQHDMQMTQLKADLQHTNDHMQSQFNSMKCEISANFDN
ncbi:PH domain-containing protein, partial [Durusdinium trenchii]